MTVITVSHVEGRIDRAQRAQLATSLTDAVMETECGQLSPAARFGFQVHFRSMPKDCMAIGGRLVDEQEMDVIVVDMAVMDGHWPVGDRARVIKATYAALGQALGVAKPPSSWWVNFRVIDEGSWGSRGRVLSALDLLATGAFTVERAEQIRQSIGARS